MVPPLRPGEQVPRFVVDDLRGGRIAYADLWQRKHLLLVRLPAADAAAHPYVAELSVHREELTAHDGACVITGDDVPGLAAPGVLVADKWGEIFFVADELTAVQELREWLRFVKVQCPECQGETR